MKPDREQWHWTVVWVADTSVFAENDAVAFVVFAEAIVFVVIVAWFFAVGFEVVAAEAVVATAAVAEAGDDDDVAVEVSTAEFAVVLQATFVSAAVVKVVSVSLMTDKQVVIVKTPVTAFVTRAEAKPVSTAVVAAVAVTVVAKAVAAAEKFNILIIY